MEGSIKAGPPPTHVHPSPHPRAFSVDLYHRRSAAGLHPEAYELRLRSPTTAGGASALRYVPAPFSSLTAGPSRCVGAGRIYVSSVVANAW